MIVVVNGADVELPDGGTVGDLLDRLGLAGRVVIVEHNGQPLPRGTAASAALADGDRLELVRAVAGG